MARASVSVCTLLAIACQAILGAPGAAAQAPGEPVFPPAESVAKPAEVMPTPAATGGPARAPEPTVVDVRVVGNRATSLSKIHGVLATRAGRPFDQGALENDVRKLVAKGWFLDVKTLHEEVPTGIIVTFQVVERPTLEFVRFVGNVKIKSKTLAKQAEIKRGDALDPYAVEEGRRKMEEFYKTKGYNNVRITILEGTKPKDHGAIYVIHEGPAQKIWKVNVVGNSIDSAARLKTQIQSKPPYFYFFRGYVDRKKIDEDVERLTAYYRSLGFFHAKVSRELEYNDEKSWLTLTFYVNEGPRYKVRNVTFIGNSKFSTAQLSENLKLKPGAFFDQTKSTKDLNEIKDRYGGVGYIFTDVTPEPRLDEQPGQLDLVYNISEGDRYRVGKINIRIEGDNPHTRHNTVRTRISIRPGDIADIRELRASERRLKSSSLFLNDPTRGIAPKLAFVPPDSDEVENVADRRKRPDRFRGQSPDSPSRDRLIDVDAAVMFDPAPSAPAAAPTQQMRPQIPTSRQQGHVPAGAPQIWPATRSVTPFAPSVPSYPQYETYR